MDKLGSLHRNLLIIYHLFPLMSEGRLLWSPFCSYTFDWVMFLKKIIVWLSFTIVILAACGGRSNEPDNINSGDTQMMSFHRRPAPPDIGFTIDGRSISLDVPPLEIGGVLMVPVDVLRHLGFFLRHDESTGIITATGVDGSSTSFSVGSTLFINNGVQGAMNAAPIIAYGRAMIPADFVGEVAPVSFSKDAYSLHLRVLEVLHLALTESALSMLEPGASSGYDTAFLTQSESNLIGNVTGSIPNRVLTLEEVAAWAERYAARGPASLELEVVRLTNAARLEYGLPPLEMDLSLMMAARFKSQSMFDLQYFSHMSPVYGAFGSIPAIFGASGNLGENIALANGANAGLLFDIWMDSPEHRVNILSPDWTVIGVGEFGGRASQLFSSRVSTAETGVSMLWLPLTVSTLDPVHVEEMDNTLGLHLLGTGGRLPANEIGLQIRLEEGVVDPIEASLQVSVTMFDPIIFDGDEFPHWQDYLLTHTFPGSGRYYVRAFARGNGLGVVMDHEEVVVIITEGEESPTIFVTGPQSEDVFAGVMDSVDFPVATRNLDYAELAVTCTRFDDIRGMLIIAGGEGSLSLSGLLFLEPGTYALELTAWAIDYGYNLEFIAAFDANVYVLFASDRLPHIEVVGKRNSITAGSRANVTFDVLTENIPDGVYTEGDLDVWQVSPSLSRFDLPSAAIIVSSDSGNLTLDVDARNLDTGLVVELRLHLRGEGFFAEADFVLTILDEDGLEPPSLFVGAQDGELMHGNAGHAMFSVSTSNMENGLHPVRLENDLPIGASFLGSPGIPPIGFDGFVQINDDSGVFFVNVNENILAGNFGIRFSMLVGNRMAAGSFTLVIEEEEEIVTPSASPSPTPAPEPVPSITIHAQQGVLSFVEFFYGGISFRITSQNLPDGSYWVNNSGTNRQIVLAAVGGALLHTNGSLDIENGEGTLRIWSFEMPSAGTYTLNLTLTSIDGEIAVIAPYTVVVHAASDVMPTPTPTPTPTRYLPYTPPPSPITPTPSPTIDDRPAQNRSITITGQQSQGANTLEGRMFWGSATFNISSTNVPNGIHEIVFHDLPQPFYVESLTISNNTGTFSVYFDPAPAGRFDFTISINVAGEHLWASTTLVLER